MHRSGKTQRARMNRQITWGLVATIKAPVQDILNFAAYHLDLGAHRLHIYLDAPNPEAYPFLKAHPRIKVTTCNEAYWKRRKRKRPPGHQFRQTLNASQAYRRIEADWIGHIDVDEFLWPGSASIAEHLAEVPSSARSARVFAIESLAGHPGAYKMAVPNGPDRDRVLAAIYPNFGIFLKGGFISHTAGKVFARTGLDEVQIRIHNMMIGGNKDPEPHRIAGIDLCHHHAEDWDHWYASYRYRLEKGSYRADLSPAFERVVGGMNTHELLSMIEGEQGKAGLRAFFEEINVQGDGALARLEGAGLVKRRDLGLDAKRRKHFPHF